MTGFNCLLLVTSLPAATVTVNSLADSGPGSLREALNSSAAWDTIQVTAQGTLLLTTGLLEIPKSLTITGPGTNHLSLDGQSKTPIFSVPPGVTATINDLTLTNGFSHFLQTNVAGGAIRNFGSLTLNRCVVAKSNNREGLGGGIANSGSLTVNDCTFYGNGSPFLFGGAIASLGTTASLTVNRSVIVGNFGTDGAGIYAEGTTLIRDCTISSNVVDNGSAGISCSGTTTIIGSCIVRNSTFHGLGAGIGADGTFLLLSNCTVTGNSIFDNSGGGIWTRAALTLIKSCTITSNRCDLSEPSNQGGGLFISAGEVRCHNTIIAGNSAPNGPDCSGTLISEGYNLIQDPSGCNISGDTTGLLLNLDARLEPLQNNGGPTLTHALLPTSPALDAGSPTSFPSVDQRGFSRPRDANNDCVPISDLGAVEIGDPCLPTLDSISLVPGNMIQLKMSGCSNGTYAIQATPSLPASAWTTFATRVAGNTGSFEYQSAIPPTFPYRFFRVQKVCAP
ncbi:MAG: hypothetical protein JWM16_2764 [Verrucomicrobiales bacterium]|nr:hypothetical protein [Verrucomicrobiales bacterium]